MELARRAGELLRTGMDDVGFVSGGEFYFPMSAARRAIELCRSQALAVLGIEAFTVKDNKLTPDLGLIADFSSIVMTPDEWCSVVTQTIDEAELFVGRVAADRFLNFTILSEEDSWRASPGTSGPARS